MLTPAVALPIAVAYAIALYALVFTPAAIAALKGHAIWLLAGVVLTPLIWWYAAIRLALPGSWWEHHHYGPEKRAAARERYGETASRPWLTALAGSFLLLPFVVGFVAALLAE